MDAACERLAHRPDRRDVLQLVGVDDRCDPAHGAIRDIDCPDANQQAVGVEDERAGSAVHRHRPDRAADPFPHAGPCEQGPRDVGAADDRVPEGGRLAAAVATEHDVLGENRLEGSEIAALDRREEARSQSFVLAARDGEPRALLADVATGADRKLANVRRLQVEDLGDLVVLVAEDVAQQEDRSLLGREALEHGQERERERVEHLGALRGVAFRRLDERLREPVAHVFLAPHACGPEVVNRQAGGDGGDVRDR